MHGGEIHFLFFFFDFKRVKTPREAEQLFSLISNHQPKEDSRKFLCLRPLPAQSAPSPHSVPRSEADESVLFPLEILILRKINHKIIRNF